MSRVVMVTVWPGVRMVFPVLRRPTRNLGTLEVLKDGDRTAGAFGGGADQIEALLMVLVHAVGKIEPGHVHPRFDHCGHLRGGVGGGAEGANDPGLTTRALP